MELSQDSTDNTGAITPTTPIPTKIASPATPSSFMNYRKRKSIGGTQDGEIPSTSSSDQRNDRGTVELCLQINNDGVAAPVLHRSGSLAMVVCRCRKAARFYCFIHQVPVCDECICFSEHQLCVVKDYAEWVVNSDYDWTHCSFCNSVLEAGSDETTRLGCLHVMHTKCLISHVQSSPTQTAPAGFVCPSCSIPIWPSSSIKDTGSRHAKLKEVVAKTGLEKNLFGDHFVTVPKADAGAFASDPLLSVYQVLVNLMVQTQLTFRKMQLYHQWYSPRRISVLLGSLGLLVT